MALKIEEYALIGDLQTAALVGVNGSIDWLCFPRFDGGACFCSLLGGEEHGYWQIAPAEPVLRVSRRYQPDTLVLDTDFTTSSGTVRVIDFMPQRSLQPDLVRIVAGIQGRVKMRMRCVIRFDYGKIIPWVTRAKHGIRAIALLCTFWMADNLALLKELPAGFLARGADQYSPHPGNPPWIGQGAPQEMMKVYAKAKWGGA